MFQKTMKFQTFFKTHIKLLNKRIFYASIYTRCPASTHIAKSIVIGSGNRIHSSKTCLIKSRFIMSGPGFAVTWTCYHKTHFISPISCASSKIHGYISLITCFNRYYLYSHNLASLSSVFK